MVKAVVGRSRQSEWKELTPLLHYSVTRCFQAGVDALKEDSFGRLSLTRSDLRPYHFHSINHHHAPSCTCWMVSHRPTRCSQASHEAVSDGRRRSRFLVNSNSNSIHRQGLLKRNNSVYTMCLDGKVPLVITMGGGYSRPIICTLNTLSTIGMASPHVTLVALPIVAPSPFPRCIIFSEAEYGHLTMSLACAASVLAHADVYRSAAFRYNARYGIRQQGSNSSGSLP